MHNAFQVAYCLPVLRPQHTTDTSYLHQTLIIDGLRARRHGVTVIAPSSLSEVVSITDSAEPKPVVRTWSQTSCFNFARKATWRVQKGVGIPYLNVFSNLCLYDACLQCLPGHDIVQARNGLYKMGAAMACRRLGLPYFLFFDADDILEHDIFGKPLKGILRWRAAQVIRYNLDTADVVICVSEMASQHLQTAWQLAPDKIAVFPNGVDVNRFRPYPEQRTQVRSRLGAGDGPLIVFVGSFFPYQDVAVLLEAFATILTDYPLARLLLVGEGEQYADMVRHAGSLGISQSVTFTGFLPQADIPPLISSADVAVAPYSKMQNELFLGSSMKVFEYMASGVAVVATNQGQISEVVQDGVNGMLVPPGDAPALSAALQKLIHDPGLRSRLGQQARRDAMERHSWERYIARLEQLYATAIDRRRAGRQRAS